MSLGIRGTIGTPKELGCPRRPRWTRWRAPRARTRWQAPRVQTRWPDVRRPLSVWGLGSGWPTHLPVGRGGGGGGAVSPPPLPAFCHHAVAATSVAKHKCAATVYGASLGPNRTHFSHHPFTGRTSPPCSPPVGTAPTLAGLRVPPFLATPPRPPSLLLAFSFSQLPPSLPIPQPTLPCGLPLALCCRLVLLWQFWQVRVHLLLPSLELVVLELEEEEEELGCRRRFCPHTHPS